MSATKTRPVSPTPALPWWELPMLDAQCHFCDRGVGEDEAKLTRTAKVYGDCCSDLVEMGI